MQQAFDREQVRSVVRGWRQQGLKIALVPTMGNLHAGHLALIGAARKKSDRVVASIYVNPTQFGAGEDYGNYPRTLDADREALEASGCDLLFAPDHATIYPAGIENAVRIIASPDLALALEGQFRPGHFDGVLTVVARLFNLVCPDLAVFGEKDYQQLQVIRRMVQDLSFDIRVIPVRTVRERNGLAMSSRNNYLETAQKEAASHFNAVLEEVVEQVIDDPASWRRAEKDATARLEQLGFRIDYVSVRRARDLERPSGDDGKLRVLGAVWCGSIRLIDNMKIN